jgi:copper chaperone CopZ
MAHGSIEDTCCNSDNSKVEEKIMNRIEKTVTSVFSVSGMDCADEIAAIQKSLTHSKIAKITANLMTSLVSVEHDPSLKKEDIATLWYNAMTIWATQTWLGC